MITTGRISRALDSEPTVTRYYRAMFNGGREFASTYQLSI